MPRRRTVLSGLAASVLLPGQTWASAGNPAYLAAALRPRTLFSLCGLTETGELAFSVPMLRRGHAAAAHPSRPIAVAFARRPGLFALVIDCVSGTVQHRLSAPEGRHFYGHGTFSADGKWLYTTENDYDRARGVIGVWDAENGFGRAGAFSSGGIGPHDMRLMPDGRHLVVANGGIETHPDSGRAKLNLPTMRPNISFLDTSGTVVAQFEPPPEWQRNSLRHLSVLPDGRVAVACQWQGDPQDSPPLFAICDMKQGLRFFAGAPGLEREMVGYAGSIASSRDGQTVAITGPRGGVAAVFDAGGTFRRVLHAPDICGVAPAADGLTFTTGKGAVLTLSRNRVTKIASHVLNWDNHLISLRPV